MKKISILIFTVFIASSLYAEKFRIVLQGKNEKATVTILISELQTSQTETYFIAQIKNNSGGVYKITNGDTFTFIMGKEGKEKYYDFEIQPLATTIFDLDPKVTTTFHLKYIFQGNDDDTSLFLFKMSSLHAMADSFDFSKEELKKGKKKELENILREGMKGVYTTYGKESINVFPLLVK